LLALLAKEGGTSVVTTPTTLTASVLPAPRADERDRIRDSRPLQVVLMPCL